MSVKFFVTVGVSALEQSRCWKWKGVDDSDRNRLQAMPHGEFVEQTWSKAAPGDASTTMYQFLEDQRGVILKSAYGSIGQFADNVRKHFDTGAWSSDRWRSLPAELGTIYKLCEGGYLQDGDTITLLHGIDESGSKARVVLAAMIEKLLAEPARKPRLPAILTKSIELDWNPQNVDQFALQLNKTLEDKLGNSLAGSRFILTGGYKAAGQFIAHWLGRRSKGTAGEPAIIVMHDSSEEAIVLPSSCSIRPGASRQSDGRVSGSNQ